MLIVFLLALNSQSDLFNSFPLSFFLRILCLPSFTRVFCPNRLIFWLIPTCFSLFIFSLSPVYSNEARPPTLGFLSVSPSVSHHEHRRSLARGPWAAVPDGHLRHTCHPDPWPRRLHRCCHRRPSQPGGGASASGWGPLTRPGPQPEQPPWGRTLPGSRPLQEVTAYLFEFTPCSFSSIFVCVDFHYRSSERCSGRSHVQHYCFRSKKPPPLHTGADWKVVLHLPEIEKWLRATSDRVTQLTHSVGQDSINRHVDVHLVQLKVNTDVSDWFIMQMTSCGFFRTVTFMTSQSVSYIQTRIYASQHFCVVFMKIHSLTLRQQITHNAFLPSPRALCYVTTGFHRSRYWPLSSLCNSSRSDWFFILFVSGGFYIRGAEVSSGAVWFTHFIPTLFLKGEIHPKTNIKLLLLTCY